MPTFDFQCERCDHRFEYTRPFGSTTHPSCPACKSKKTRKHIAPPAIQFRGSGFYKTDAQSPAAPTQKKERKTTDTSVAPDSAPGSSGSEKGSKTSEK